MILLFVFNLIAVITVRASLDIPLQEFFLVENSNRKLILNITQPSEYKQLIVIPQHEDIINVEPRLLVDLDSKKNVTVSIFGLSPGHSKISFFSNETNKYNIYNTARLMDNYNVYVNRYLEDVIRVTIFKLELLNDISTVFGWIYFTAWSVSFYPQIYTNFKRKSVVGLNFDFLALNLVGFTLYSIYNLGLYYVTALKDEYSSRYSRGVNPIQIHDILFAVHAIIVTIFTILQCCIYERNKQRVSNTASAILVFFGSLLIITFGLSYGKTIHWLDFMYVCSYIKLTITLIKYIPQAYMNYSRKSTIGWSIGNIFLDFTGGIFSMVQMFILAYNYNDWLSILGDFTKFGLGLFSIIFDIFFILQHYVFYRDTTYNSEIPQ